MEQPSLDKRAIAAGLTGITLAAAIFIAPFEGENLHTNNDPVGVKEICFGHTPGVSIDMSVDDKQCIVWLGEDIGFARNVVEKSSPVKLSQKTEIAFISFVYNVGVGKKSVKDGFIYLKNGNYSRMYKYLRAGDLVKACGQFTNWTKSLPGLRRRRAEEQRLCLEGLL